MYRQNGMWHLKQMGVGERDSPPKEIHQSHNGLLPISLIGWVHLSWGGVTEGASYGKRRDAG